jgi:hypothetical protein
MYRFLAIQNSLKYTQVILIALRNYGSEYQRFKWKSKLDTALCCTLCHEDTWRNITTVPSSFTLPLDVYDQVRVSAVFSRRNSYQGKDLVKKPTGKRPLGM